MSLLERETGRGTLPWWQRPPGGEVATLVPAPSGPLAEDAVPGPVPPAFGAGRLHESLRLGRDIAGESFAGTGARGDVFTVNVVIDPQPVVVVSHPDHVKSLLSHPVEAPSTAGQSPIRPIVGLSVITAVGDQHRRRRKLLMPSFHGEAIARYLEQIHAATAREIDRWPTGHPLELTTAAQAITLDVIMAGVFGIPYGPDGLAGTDAERRLRDVVRWVLKVSTTAIGRTASLVNSFSARPLGPQGWALGRMDRAIHAVIAERRAQRDGGSRHDVLSLLLEARDEDGAPLADDDLRNELVTLLLAGHETTANTIAWAFERLLRTPPAYDRLRDAVRSDAPRDGHSADAWVEATLDETMRVRPVVPVIGRRATVLWQFGEFTAPARSRVLVAIPVLHHRPDVYPDPYRFDPTRFLGVKPSSHLWLPFGGGDRRCLGAALAMAEMRVVLTEIARRTDLTTVDDAPERPMDRNVTMIPAQGGRVIATSVRP